MQTDFHGHREPSPQEMAASTGYRFPATLEIGSHDWHLARIEFYRLKQVMVSKGVSHDAGSAECQAFQNHRERMGQLLWETTCRIVEADRLKSPKAKRNQVYVRDRVEDGSRGAASVGGKGAEDTGSTVVISTGSLGNGMESQ